MLAWNALKAGAIEIACPASTILSLFPLRSTRARHPRSVRGSMLAWNALKAGAIETACPASTISTLPGQASPLAAAMGSMPCSLRVASYIRLQAKRVS